MSLESRPHEKYAIYNLGKTWRHFFPRTYMHQSLEQQSPPGKYRMFCVSIVGQDQRESIERSMKDTVDEMISAFDRHLEDSATSAKQQFRWMKRRYREKIDVNRAASRIELKVRGPL